MMLLLVLACACARAGAAEITKLTVEERAGAARTDEPVTVGVPLPRGRVSDASRLYLADAAGKEVPCQFTATAKWLDGESVKWVLLNFKASVAAKGKAVFALNLADADKTPGTRLTAKQEGDLVTVDTGRVKFTVRGKKFNGFCDAWYDASGKGNFTDANRVIAGDAKSGCVSASGGKDYFSALDGEGKVSIERRGPMEVVVKAEGSHRNAAGERLFDYVVRFHAYADSPVVRVSHTFVNRQGDRPADRFPMDALEFVVPTTLKGGSALVGLEGGETAAGKTIGALQRTSDEMLVTADGKRAGAAKGKSTKPLSTGWAGLGRGSLGLAAGVRWFWQMHPKKLAVDAGGVLKLSLFPRDKLRSGDVAADKLVQQPFDVYMGQSRTHYITFLFHKGLPPARLAEFFTGTQRPLLARAPLKYYCRDTACIGYIAESEKELFDEAAWARVQSYDRKMLESLVSINKKIDGHTYTHYSDSYGLYAWGDVFHWGWKAREKSPKDTYEWKLSWAGNYYEFPNACLVQFLRTGDWRYWDRFVPHAMHVGDVFTCHYHPRKELRGACRYCPPRNHVSTDDGAPYVSSRFNHHKSQCVFSLYYLTGDLRALDNCRLIANNAVNYRGADNAGQARGPGAHVVALWQVYEQWPTEKHLARLKGMARKTAGRLGRKDKKLKSRWMWGIAFEGVVCYLWAHPEDKETFEQIRTGIDKLGSEAGKYSNMSLANAYVYAVTGEEKYRDLAWSALKRSKAKNRPKTFGIQWRNTGFALYFLSKACQPGKFKPER
jgi:hypothetical protein